MEGEIKNVFNVWLSIFASLCYCYFIPSKIPNGKFRLFFILPIFYLFTILPFSLTSTFATAITSFFITWLASFKLLLFAFDQGPLSGAPANSSLLRFIAIASLPIKIKQEKNDRFPQTSQRNESDISVPQFLKHKLPLNLATEGFSLAVLAGILIDYKEMIHQNIVMVFYFCMVFLLIDVLIAVSNAIVRTLFGLELEPPSDEPYLSTSLQEFWGKRWNLMVTNILRATVYKPVRIAATRVLGQDLAPLPAVLAAFLVSGLMHELLFYHVTRATPTWETTAYFVLHGVCVVVEFGVKSALAGKFQLPWFLSWPLTMGIMAATSFWLFFPPLMRSGADAMAIGELKIAGEFLKSRVNVSNFL